MFFPEHGVRFIALSDNVDSARGDEEFTGLRNWFNDFYARDTSKKIKASMHTKALAGKHLTGYPVYGYKQDPEDKSHWIVYDTARSRFLTAAAPPRFIAFVFQSDNGANIRASFEGGEIGFVHTARPAPSSSTSTTILLGFCTNNPVAYE